MKTRILKFFTIILLLPVITANAELSYYTSLLVIEGARQKAEDTVGIAKVKLKDNEQELEEAKRLYKATQRHYNRLIKLLLHAAQHESYGDIDKASEDAQASLTVFENHVRDRVKTMGVIGDIGTIIVDAAKAISEEIRGWREYSDDKKQKEINSLKEINKWLDWEEL